MFRTIPRSADGWRRLVQGMAAAAALLTLAGCAIAPMGAPVPSVQNMTTLRAAGVPPLALGEFSLAPDKDLSMDQHVTIRGNLIHSPYGSSFARYLKETFATDMRAAGVLDPASRLVLTGQLTDSHIDVPVGPANATLAAHFVLTRDGARVFEKELRVRADWEAEFIGASAIPMGLSHYTELYRQLAKTLFEDPQFRAALRAS